MSTNTLDFQYDAGGALLGFKYKNVPYYYLRNAQGDITTVCSTDGDIRTSYIYDAWGVTLKINAASIYTAANPFRYRGYMYDVETGLYFLQTRAPFQRKGVMTPPGQAFPKR